MNPNILFIVIDSLRQDRLYGKSKTSLTPNLDYLTKNSSFFTQTISSADGTILSLTSIFNSLYPFKTGVRSRKILLKKDNYLEQLKKIYYHIYGIIPGPLSYFSAISNYFENKNFTYSAGPPAELLSEGYGTKIVQLLDNKKLEKPWFFYIHIMDLHWPLVVPSEYDDDKFGHDKYDKILSSIDPWIGSIVKKIDPQKTLIVLTADHGHHTPLSDKSITDFEPDLSKLKTGKLILPKSVHPLGSSILNRVRSIIRDYRLAKENKNLTPYEKRSRLPYYTLSLYDESIHVPFLLYGYKINSIKITSQVRSIDIFPTIADLISMSSTNHDIHGRSLVPFMKGEVLDEIPVYLHTTPYEKPSLEDMVGLRTSNYKYFRHSRNEKSNIHLYDIINDPFENQNIAKIRPELVIEMENKLKDIQSDATLTIEQDDVNDEEKEKIEQELKKLGYM